MCETTVKRFDRVGFIMDLESGDVSESRLVEGMQHLIDDGSVWQLQGFYGRLAMRLIERGLCHHAGETVGAGGKGDRTNAE